jgi:hypothetical protein
MGLVDVTRFASITSYSIHLCSIIADQVNISHFYHFFMLAINFGKLLNFFPTEFIIYWGHVDST